MLSDDVWVGEPANTVVTLALPATTDRRPLAPYAWGTVARR
jgi:hypothetical protein